jgi:predicted transcriptional regulator
MNDEERAAVREGLEQARRGEFASDKEMDTFWAKIGEALSCSAEDVRQGKFATEIK